LAKVQASGLPGHLTSIGLGTFIDPRQEGGKMNRRTQAAPDLVQVVTIRGEEFLWLDAVPIDWVIIRGTTADSQGNISAEEEPMRLEILPAVFAGRRWDGTVVAQVKRVVERGQIPPRLVEVPGPHVHYVVRAESPEHDHRQTSSWVYDPNFSEIGYRPSVREEAEPVLDIRRVIGRRAALEAGPGNIINMGTGIPNDIIGAEMVHEGVDDLVTLTVESGVYGGRPVGGVDFGIAKNPDALIEHPYQFDFYNGRGVDVTFMGFGEMDSAGNVNATKLGERATGAGGFIDITQCAKKVVFCGTFTARGLNVDIGPGFIRVLEEGRVLKCVDHVQQISFNGRRAVQQGQTVVVVTERAVFHLGAEGWVLDEIAPGIDLYRDVLARMAFTPIIPAVLPSMDPVIFTEAALGLRDRWCPTSTPRSSH
jgi:propionate CoA-transferase